MSAIVPVITAGQSWRATPARVLTVAAVVGDVNQPDLAVVNYHNTVNPDRIETISLTSFRGWIARVFATLDAQPAPGAQNPNGGAQPSA